MFKNVVITTALFVFTLVALPSQTNAQNMSDALARMDEIIAEMQKLRTEFSALSASLNGGTTAPTPAVQGAASGKTLTMDLSFGETNEDIERIQRLLATDPEIYDHPYVTGYFGSKTEEAIKNFQTRFGLDPVGVIGPATTALLEVFFAAYPDGNYPDGVLANKPAGQVQGSNTSVVSKPSTSVASGNNPAKFIDVEFDDGESLVEIRYVNGNRKGFIVDSTSQSTVVSYIASHTPLSEAQVWEVVDFNGRSNDDDDDDDDDRGDDEEEEADNALDDAEDEIEDAEDEIDEADEDGDDVDWAEDTLDEAEDLLEEAEEAYDDEDWEEAIDLAKDAKKMAKKAKDRIDEEEDNDDDEEIDEIKADIGDGETDITVEYKNGDEDEFTVEEDDEEDIIEEVADELDIDEDEVEDLIEFDYGRLDEIEVRIGDEGEKTLIRVFYSSGAEKRIRTNETDEDEIIELIADEIDEDEDDIEEVIDFDY